jgi:hypothetical protein
MLSITNHSNLSEQEFAPLSSELSGHSSLAKVLAWASSKPASDVFPQIVAEVVTQDEFTHDVIVPYRDLFLVYDTT